MTQKDKRKKLLLEFVKQEIKEHKTQYHVAKKYDINPGILYNILNLDGFSPSLWKLANLPEPPPRKRLCIEDPTGYLVEMLDWICERNGWTRSFAFSYMLGLMVVDIVDKELET
ncbi:MAG: hypothetical protein DRI46_08105 [Chloroflexi bacterium]|nr:MAG: hypothetical protein DRI46_08105 [Chloroflexota bacterium]